MRPARTLLLFALIFALVSACGDDPVAEDTNNGGTDTTVPDTNVTADAGPSVLGCIPAGTTPEGLSEVQADCTLATDLTGKTFIVDKMVLTAPANQALLEQLNSLFESDIQAGKLALLFHMKTFDAETGTATVLIGDGELKDDNYQWLYEPPAIELTFDGCNYTTKEPTSFSLQPASTNKPIKVSAMTVCGQISSDGAKITFAYLNGSLRKADATGLNVEIAEGIEADLAELFESFSVELVNDTDGDGSPDAWDLRGTLTGKAVTNVAF